MKMRSLGSYNQRSNKILSDMKNTSKQSDAIQNDLQSSSTTVQEKARVDRGWDGGDFLALCLGLARLRFQQTGNERPARICDTSTASLEYR